MKDRRPTYYGALDLLFGAAYAYLFSAVIPNRFSGYSLLVWALVASFVLAGAGTLSRRPWGWRIACVSCTVLLIVALAILVLIIVSAAFLAGVYGALGQGAAILALVLAALSIQMFALVPALQLKYLRTRAGRQSFAQ